MKPDNDELINEGLILGIRILERLAYLITQLMTPRYNTNEVYMHFGMVAVVFIVTSSVSMGLLAIFHITQPGSWFLAVAAYLFIGYFAAIIRKVIFTPLDGLLYDVVLAGAAAWLIQLSF